MYTGPTILTSNLVFYLDSANTKCVYQESNKLNDSSWIAGSGSVTGFNINGTSAENIRATGNDPFGKSAIIWESNNNDVTSNDDGGWNTTNIAIDPTKLYRFSVWIKREVQGDGNAYLGCQGNDISTTNIGVYRRDNGVLNTNAYFWVSGSPPNSELPTNEWVLITAHVWPAGSGSGSNHTDSGRYTINSGKIGNITYDCVWHPDNAYTMHRSYLYYSTDATTIQKWCYPRIDLCDGTEPSVQDLLENKSNIVRDLSHTPNNTVITNNINFDTSKKGNLVFDGIDDYIDFYAPNLGNTTTVEMWCKIGTNYSGKMLFGWSSYDIYCSSGSIAYNTGNDDAYGINSTTVTSLGIINNWTHYVFEMRSDVSYTNNKIYINGSLQSLSQIGGTELSGNRNFKSGLGRIGIWRAGLISYYMPMSLSIFKVYNRALTQEEITNNYNSLKTRFS